MGDGNVVPTANNLVHFNLHGQGQIVGVDNGGTSLAVNVIKLKDGKYMAKKAFCGKAKSLAIHWKRSEVYLYADSV